VGFNRLALIIFGALFVVLFVIFAVAQGIGQPSVPSGDVAIVKGVSDGNVSEAELKRVMAQQVAGNKLKKAPKAGSTKYEELQTQALGELLDAVWIGAEAEELGISATDKQIETELANIKKQSFPTEKSYQEFLKNSHFTQQDVDNRVELQVLSQEIQKQITNQAPPPTSAEISDFYEENKVGQFTTEPSRDVRVLFTNKKADAEKAKELLEEDDSPANWKKVTVKYSEDPTAKEKGGLQEGITEELLSQQAPLVKAIFGSGRGEVVGPTRFEKIFFVTEVEKLNLKKVKTLDEVKSEISAQLTQQIQQEYFENWFKSYKLKWAAQSYCSSQIVALNQPTLSERCANFKGSGRPAGAPEACYEANPKTPATECPAPVEQTKPAVPGSITPLKPTGEPLVQRPLPELGKKPAAERAAEVLEKSAEKSGE
jgi:parvulin-like peptidyl-prolyl isomerase